MLIVGAGLSGLIAGMMLPDAHIIEAGSSEQVNHKALLRFRSPIVGQVTGVDFKKVLVRKGIWMGGKFHEPNIQLANMYSQKVTGKIQNRSIWDIAPVERWIAPEDFAQRLSRRLDDRITWNNPFHYINYSDIIPIISTIPLESIMRQTMQSKVDLPAFEFERIVVGRFRVPNCNVHQTIYFPDPDVPAYRASITGDMLIVESVFRDDTFELDVNSRVSGVAIESCMKAFDIHCSMTEIGIAQQKFGKISPIDDRWRKSAIRDLSVNHKIYSLGRFATWRNILLDDVVNDVYVIKRLIESDAYDGARIAS